MIRKEIKRISLLTQIEHATKTKLTDFMIYESDKSLDPVLSILTTSYGLPDKQLVKINKLLKSAIKTLNSTKFIKEVNMVEKKSINRKQITLTYKPDNISIIVNKEAYSRIKRQCIDKSFKNILTLDELLWILYFRYTRLHLYNNSQGAVHPKYYKILSTKYKTETEGFGSFFNHTLKYYYGLFPDLEKYFGCLGNFFTSTLTKPFYVVNPPFTIPQMNLTIDHMIDQLQCNKNLTILFVIPAWVYEDRVKLSKKCKRYIKLEKYDDTVNIDKLHTSGFVKQYLLYCQENFLYYDYLKEQDVKFAPTNIILLSNTKKHYNMESIFGKSDLLYKGYDK